MQVQKKEPLWAAAKAWPGGAFYGLLALLVVGWSAAYAALVLYSASWPEAAALRDFHQWEPRGYTAGEFGALRRALAGLALAALGLAAGLGATPAGRAQVRALGQQVRQAGRGGLAAWRALPRGQQYGALGGLLALTALRVYYSLVLVPADDGVSYEVFVRAHLLGVSAAYPYPNNHVLSNTVSWAFYQVNPGFWWSMRLPVLLTATGATALWFLALLRASSFRVALLAVSSFSVLQLSFYHAVTGRGYWLLVGLGAVGFFAVLALTAAGPAPRRVGLAWAGLVLSGVLGLYTVPTHAYLLLSAYGWLGLSLVRARAWRALATTGAMGLLTLAGAGLLYAPLLLISGFQLLVHNGYVQALPPGEFWRGLPAYLWLNEGWLSGHRWLGLVPLLVVLAGLWWVRQHNQHRPALALRRLVGPCLWFLAAPYLLVVVQRVQPPERTLFYKSMLLCVLAALLADWVLDWVLAPVARRRATGLLVAAGVAGAATQLALLARHNNQQLAQWQIYRQPMAWLATQPAGPVLVPASVARYLLRFTAHTDFKKQHWQIDDRPRPGVHYRYLVSKPGAQYVPAGPPVAGPPAFHGMVDIYVAP
jgi:hypothetical protein